MVLQSAIRLGLKLARAEPKFWRQLWKSPYDKFIRFSIGAGGVIGELNNESSTTDSTNGTISTGSRAQPKANKFSQKYSRRNVPYRGRRRNYDSKCRRRCK